MSKFIDEINKQEIPLSKNVLKNIYDPPPDVVLPSSKVLAKAEIDNAYFETKGVSASAIISYEISRGQFLQRSDPYQYFDYKTSVSKTFGSIMHKYVLEKETFDLNENIFTPL